jgi:glycerol-3-phosphate dehydrogenase
VKRCLTEFTDQLFDLLVIGGGIYGAALVRLAALQGLKVGLLEKEDFGHATSANSLKIIHGGLRYLQHLDIRRMRESIIARRQMMSIAPQCIKPLACIIPTFGYGLRSRLVMTEAMWLNDLISWDRNQGIESDRHLCMGKIVSRKECLEKIPGLNNTKLTGGAVWYDAIALNTERLTLRFIQSAAELGACVANYVRADRYLCNGNTVVGVYATDVINDDKFDIKAKIIANTTGPWIDGLMVSLPGFRVPPPRVWVRAMNLIVKRSLFNGYAVGLSGSKPYVDRAAVFNKGVRDFFFVPWRNKTMIGTTYHSHFGSVDDCEFSDKDVEEMIMEVNQICPSIRLNFDDVCFVHAGLLPADPQSIKNGVDITPRKKPLIVDMKRTASIDGLLLVAGVKYTTAYQVAKKVLGLILKKLNRSHAKSAEKCPLLHRNSRLAEDTKDVSYRKREAKKVCLSENIKEHLRQQYGGDDKQILKYIEEDDSNARLISQDQTITTAEVIHSVRNEMALRLSDVVLRRTELGSAGYPGNNALEEVASIMGHELNWTSDKLAMEVGAVKKSYKHLIRMP